MFKKVMDLLKNEKGMEMIQVAILIAIAIGIGLIFKDKISTFINGIFTSLSGTNFGQN